MSTNESTSTSTKVVNEEEEEDETEVFSLQDVIEGNEVASAVLAASDPNNCSYNQGYVYRQALYCCITCLKESIKTDEKSYLNIEDIDLHAICLGCTYECHSNHELVELYTKRNFKCDCGNTKFKTKCKLQPVKDDLNQMNKYNHNFKGLFCTCNRPYPETGDFDSNNSKLEENSDEMIQCTVCEDWFHLNHLKGSEKFPTNPDVYEDIICHGCMNKNKYLWYYQGYITLKSNEQTSEVAEDEEEKLIETTSIESTETKNEEINGCLLEAYQTKFKDLDLDKMDQSCCFVNGWRSALCKCNDCLEVYKNKQVDFLLKANDSIKFYEDQGKQNEKLRTKDEDKLLDDQLSKLNRVSQIEFLHSLKDFKDDLKNFLTEFASNGQVVKRENVVQFFDELNEQRKKRKVESDQGISGYFCK
jgi:E3 ubiquitin-protein ligase UBR7